MSEALIAAVVSAVVSGIIALAGVWYQARRSSNESEGRLTASYIAETRQNTLDMLTWLAVAKSPGGREAAGPPPNATDYPRQNLALIGDAALIGRWLEAMDWLFGLPDGGRLSMHDRTRLAGLDGDLRRALAAQERLAIRGKPIREVSKTESALLDIKTRAIVERMAQIEAEATTVGPVTVEIHPSDDPAFEKAVQWAISEDDGDVAGAVKRVGDKLQAIYPNVKVQLNAREDGFGPREWKVRRE